MAGIEKVAGADSLADRRGGGRGEAGAGRAGTQSAPGGGRDVRPSGQTAARADLGEVSFNHAYRRLGNLPDQDGGGFPEVKAA